MYIIFRIFKEDSTRAYVSYTADDEGLEQLLSEFETYINSKDLEIADTFENGFHYSAGGRRSFSFIWSKIIKS